MFFSKPVSQTFVINTIGETLGNLVNALQVPYTGIEVLEETGGIYRAHIHTERAPFLIGTYGERIDAVQHLLKNILWKKGLTENIFVIVDVDNYKKSREVKIISLAEEKVEAARLTGIPQLMPYLDPYLRKIVHTHINNDRFRGITTQSVGEGKSRRLQIISAPDTVGIGAF